MCTGLEVPAIIAAVTEASAAAAPEAIAATAAPELAGMTAGTEAALGGIDALQASGMGGMGVAQQGIGPGANAAQMAGLMNNPASALSSQGMPANALKGGMGFMGNDKGAMAMQGMGLMQPQQPPPMQGGHMPQQQPPPQSLPLPYGQPGQGMQGLSPEQLKKLKMMGLL